MYIYLLARKYRCTYKRCMCTYICSTICGLVHTFASTQMLMYIQMLARKYRCTYICSTPLMAGQHLYIHLLARKCLCTYKCWHFSLPYHPLCTYKCQHLLDIGGQDSWCIHECNEMCTPRRVLRAMKKPNYRKHERNNKDRIIRGIMELYFGFYTHD